MFDFARPLRGEPVEMVVPKEPNTGLDVATIMRRLWKGTGFIVLSGLFMVASAVALLGMLTPSYTSGIQILVDPSDLHGVGDDVSPRSPQADAGVSYAESQGKVIESDNVLRRVITRMALDRDEEFTKAESSNEFLVALRSALGMEPPAVSRNAVNLALDTLRTKMTVRRPERTFVIDARVQSKDPQKAADIANAIGEAYLAEVADSRTDAARRISDSLTGRLNALRADVEEADRKVVRYRQENKLASSNGRPFNDTQIGDLNQQLVAASVKTAEARSRLDQARAMRTSDAGTSLPEMLQSTEMQALRQQYATLSRNTAELATRLGTRHPAMAEQYAQQRDLQRLIQNEKERIIETSQKDYDRAAASEAAIKKNLDAVRSDISNNDRATMGLRELERTLESRRSIYEKFLLRAREAGEQEKIDNTNIRIISAASPARQRTWPPSPKIVLPIALVLGLMLGCGIAILLGAGRERRREHRSSTFTAARALRAVDA